MMYLTPLDTVIVGSHMSIFIASLSLLYENLLLDLTHKKGGKNQSNLTDNKASSKSRTKNPTKSHASLRGNGHARAREGARRHAPHASNDAHHRGPHACAGARC
jgi:hypothetical protein